MYSIKLKYTFIWASNSLSMMVLGAWILVWTPLFPPQIYIVFQQFLGGRGLNSHHGYPKEYLSDEANFLFYFIQNELLLKTSVLSFKSKGQLKPRLV